MRDGIAVTKWAPPSPEVKQALMEAQRRAPGGKILETGWFRPSCERIMLAGDDENLWAQVLSEGGHEVLLKPFVSEEVVRSISCAVAQRGCEDL